MFKREPIWVSGVTKEREARNGKKGSDLSLCAEGHVGVINEKLQRGNICFDERMEEEIEVQGKTWVDLNTITGGQRDC